MKYLYSAFAYTIGFTMLVLSALAVSAAFLIPIMTGNLWWFLVFFIAPPAFAVFNFCYDYTMQH